MTHSTINMYKYYFYYIYMRVILSNSSIHIEYIILYSIYCIFNIGYRHIFTEMFITYVDIITISKCMALLSYSVLDLLLLQIWLRIKYIISHRHLDNCLQTRANSWYLHDSFRHTHNPFIPKLTSSTCKCLCKLSTPEVGVL